jgi:hypothetical protein
MVGAALLLALFLARPGASRLKARLTNSISGALQRRVEIGSVHLRLLPRPGFDLEDFVVHDDPAFSAEPVLRAQEVSAALRLSSLLRGRMEISRLSLTEPSLNLTRNSDGHWNLENLLEHTAKTTVAPTGKAPTESRPAFPYIEADRGRINFKFGPEKKPFALTDANYALWQDSENAWGVRLKARPMRTDINLSDTGLFTVSGTWQRAVTLRDTPVQFNMQWDGAQLGQVTRLISGRDRGWRGTVAMSAEFVGTPADLSLRSDASLEDFRRYDILGGGTLALHAHCAARYSSVDRGVHQILCQSPVGDGAVALQGEIANLLGPRHYELNLAAERIPAQSLLALVRHAKKNLPDDLLASGTVAAEFNLRAGADVPDSPELTGDGETTNLRLRSAATKTELAPDDVPFKLASAPMQVSKGRRQQPSSPLKFPDGPRLVVGPFPLRLGRPIPTTVQAWITRSGYGIAVEGEADLQRLLQTARTIGVPAAHPVAEGWTKVALQVTGEWSGFAGPSTIGTAQLHAVRAQVRGINGPIEIAATNLTLGTNDVKADAMSASVASSHWTGSFSFPRFCSSVLSCPVNFDLDADEIATDELNELFSPDPPRKRWYGFLSPQAQAGGSFLARVHATGKLSANRMMIRTLAATHVTANVELDQGHLHLTDLCGDVVGGKHRGAWQADFTLKPPHYSGAGTFEGVSLAQLAEAMHDGWISGTANAKYKIEIAGRTSSELAQSADGTVEFHMRDGALPHIALASGPLRIRRFSGTLAIHDGEVEMQEAAMDSPAAAFTVSGRASLSRKLDFKLLQEGSPGINITGTIAEPRVASARHPETRAALKP